MCVCVCQMDLRPPTYNGVWKRCPCNSDAAVIAFAAKLLCERFLDATAAMAFAKDLCVNDLRRVFPVR